MQEDRKISRRTFLSAAGGAIVSIGLPGVFRKLADAEQRALAADIRPDGRPRLPPGQQAIEKIRGYGRHAWDRYGCELESARPW